MIHYLQAKKYMHSLKKKMTDFVILSSLYVFKRNLHLCLNGKKLPISRLIVLKSKNPSLLKKEKTDSSVKRTASLCHSIIVIY